MAEEQDSANDIGEGADAPEISDYEDTTTTTAAIEYTTTTVIDDYDDGPIEDYVVKLVVDEQSNGVLSPELADALATDINGNIISPATKLYDYTTAIYDELNANSTAITGGKSWWGWSTKKLIFAGLIALCILGIILAIVFFVIGKKFKKNKRSPAAGTTTTTKAVVTKGVSQDPKYQPVPNV